MKCRLLQTSLCFIRSWVSLTYYVILSFINSLRGVTRCQDGTSRGSILQLSFRAIYVRLSRSKFNCYLRKINERMSTATTQYLIKKTQWSESASELYLPSDRRLSAKRLTTFADRGCHVISLTDTYGRILDFLDRSRYFFIK
jgi:hypothetical protein